MYLLMLSTHRHPIYPPARLQVLTGPTPQLLSEASPWYDVAPDDTVQTFALKEDAPLGRYLMLRLEGRMQRQQEVRLVGCSQLPVVHN